MIFWNRKPRIVEVEVRVEKTVTETILGSPVQVELFSAIKTECINAYYLACQIEKSLGYYHTCEDALEAHPEARVKKVKVWRIGDIYLESLKVVKINHLVAQKPKVEKGKRAKP